MRSKLIDNLKGIGITLVVIGHCIQYGSGNIFLQNNLFYTNILFRFIYSFHMPFFMLISGYLFYNSTQKHSSSEIIKSKVNRLLIPILVWTISGGVINYFINKNLLNSLGILSGYFENFNFLWAIFYASLLVLVIHRVYQDDLLAYIIVVIASNFLNAPLLFFELYLLPFFVIGYLFNKYQKKFSKYLNWKYLGGIFIILLVIYIFLFFHFTYNKYIYTSSYFIGNDIHVLFINIYRFLIGLIGSVLAILSIKVINNLIEKIKIFEILGHNSLGIYIISCYVNSLLLIKYTANFSFSYLNIIYESVIVIGICMLIISMLKLSRFTRRYLLGDISKDKK